MLVCDLPGVDSSGSPAPQDQRHEGHRVRSDGKARRSSV